MKPCGLHCGFPTPKWKAASSIYIINRLLTFTPYTVFISTTQGVNMFKRLLLASCIFSSTFAADDNMLSSTAEQPSTVIPHGQNTTETPESVVARFNQIISMLSDPSLPKADTHKYITALCKSSVKSFSTSYSDLADGFFEDLSKIRHQEISCTFFVPEVKEIFDVHSVLILQSIFDSISNPDDQRLYHAKFLLYYTQPIFMQNPAILDVFFKQGQLSNFQRLPSTAEDYETADQPFSTSTTHTSETDTSEIDTADARFIIVLNADTVDRLAVYVSKPEHIKALQEYCVSIGDRYSRIPSLVAYLAFLECDNTQKYIKDMQLTLLRTFGSRLLSDINDESISFPVQSKRVMYPIITLVMLRRYFTPGVRAIIDRMELIDGIESLLELISSTGRFSENNIPLNAKYSVDQTLPIRPEDWAFADEWLQKELPEYQEA
jgi:hypothetical protein